MMGGVLAEIVQADGRQDLRGICRLCTRVRLWPKNQMSASFIIMLVSLHTGYINPATDVLLGAAASTCAGIYLGDGFLALGWGRLMMVSVFSASRHLKWR